MKNIVKIELQAYNLLKVDKNITTKAVKNNMIRMNLKEVK